MVMALPGELSRTASFALHWLRESCTVLSALANLGADTDVDEIAGAGGNGTEYWR